MTLAAISATAGIAAFVTVLTAPASMRWARRWNAIDRPGGRKRHPRPTPRLGGLAISAGCLAGLGVSGATGLLRIEAPLDALLLASGAALALAVGVIDDVARLPARWKLVLEIVAGLLALPSLTWLSRGLAWPSGLEAPTWLLAGLSLLWIVGVLNAVNMIDGLDGLAPGFVALGAAGLTGLAALHDRPVALACGAALTGASLGFLRFNSRPARIHMGDSGSCVLGFALGVLSLSVGPETVPLAPSHLTPLLILAVPVIDAALVVLARATRPGSSLRDRLQAPFRADRLHLHFLLLDGGETPPRVVATLLLLTLGSIALAGVTAGAGAARLALGGLLGLVLTMTRLRRRARGTAGADEEKRSAVHPVPPFDPVSDWP